MKLLIAYLIPDVPSAVRLAESRRAYRVNRLWLNMVDEPLGGEAAEVAQREFEAEYDYVEDELAARRNPGGSLSRKDSKSKPAKAAAAAAAARQSTDASPPTSTPPKPTSMPDPRAGKTSTMVESDV